MKRFFLSLMSVALSALSLCAQSKIDISAKRMIDRTFGFTPDLSARVDDVAALSAREKAAAQPVTLFVECDGNGLPAVVEAMGGAVVSSRGDIAIVTVPVGKIEELALSEQVRLISAPCDLKPMLDQARLDSKADEVLSGTGLETPYTGRGVIAGIFDNGFDVNHVNFMNDDLSDSRVRRVWLYGSSQEPDEYADADVSRFTTDNSGSTHGTHVLGIMAGSYAGESTYAVKKIMTSVKNGPMPYYGIAKDAEIAVGCGPLSFANILNGIDKISDYAGSVGKPVVINLSLGLLDGPQDGTDITARYLARAGEDAVIVVASGNDASYPLTVSKTFSDGDTEVRTCIALDRSSKQQGAVEIWGSDDDIYTVKVGIVDLSTRQLLSTFDLVESTAAESVYLTTENYNAPGYNHDASFDLAFQSSYVLLQSNVSVSNNRYQVAMQYSLTPNASTNSDLNLTLALIVEGNLQKRVDLKVVEETSAGLGYFTSNGMDGWTDGSGVMSVSGIACADNVICVGSYNTRVSWATLDKKVYSYNAASGLTTVGEVSAFSSYGKTVNGKSLPHITAPGAGIMSSYSSYYCTAAGLTKSDLSGSAEYGGKTHWWALSQGTSMACPHVSGVVALWLEADPSLKVGELIDIIQKTAVKDEFVTDNAQWGAGKLDALAGLKEVLSRKAGVGTVFADDENALIVRDLGGRRYNVFVAGEQAVTVSLVAVNGSTVKSIAADTNDIDLDASAVAPGVYILAVDGSNSRLTRKIVIR